MGKKIVYLLGLASLLNDTSSEAIYSLLPYYVQDTALIGLLGGLFNGLGSIMKVLFGYVSDRIGRRKPLVIAGYFLSALAKTLMGIVHVVFLPLLVLVDRIGKGVRDSPRDAILAELKEKGAAFGIHRAFDTLGAFLGTLLAYYFLSVSFDYHLALLLAGSIAILSIIPLLLLPTNGGSKVGRRIQVEWKLLIPAALFGLIFVSPMLFISEAKKSLGNIAILLYALYNVAFILSSLYLGKRSDVVGRRKVIVLGAVFTAMAFLLMAIGMPLLAFPVYGAGVGAIQPALFALVGDRSKSKGTAMGAFQAVYGLSIIISSFVLGELLKVLGSGAFLPYVLLPFLSILSLPR